ncbi:HutP family protein, partial [Clostridium sporogenes]
MKIQSEKVAKASVKMAISSRDEEKILIEKFKAKEILATAVDVGGNINTSMTKIIERALVASKRCGLIKDCHV